MYIDDLSAINEVNMDYEVTLFLRQVWTDTRLAYGQLTNSTIIWDHHNFDSELIDKLWTPNIFFTKEKRAMKHTVMKSNRFLEINPNGEIMISERVTLVSHCFMDFKMFPFDSQLCQISIESFDLPVQQKHWKNFVEI